MKRSNMIVRMGFAGLLAAGAVALSTPAYAVIEFDQNVTPEYFNGSGVTNGSFTTDRQNNVEIGLRGKLRHDASGQAQNIFNSNGDGTYSFPAGVAPTQGFPTAVWSFEWSVNVDLSGSGGRTLSGLSYEFGLDVDPSAGQSFNTFDPILGVEPIANAVCWDHAMGDNSTGTDDETFVAAAACRSGDIPTATQAASDYADNIDTFSVAQNSWKAHWFFSPFDPNVDGIYTIYLAAFDGSTEVARSTINILVGDVPEPATIGLFGVALAGLGVARRRRRG